MCVCVSLSSSLKLIVLCLMYIIKRLLHTLTFLLTIPKIVLYLIL